MIEAARLLRSMGSRYIRSLRSQYWDEQTRNRLTEVRLAGTLDAAMKIPFYSRRYGRRFSIDDFRSLPIIRRSEILELNTSVRSLYPSKTQFAADRSSGSTGMPAEFLFDASHQAGRFAARTRYLTQNGWSPFKRTAWIIPLPENTPDGRLMRKRKLLGSRFLSVFAPVERQVEWLLSFDPHFVYSLPSNLELLADAFDASGRHLPSLRRVFSGGEVLEDTHRRKVRSAWGVDISDNYGSTEGFCAWECPHRSLHINSEHMLIEILDENGAPPESGNTGQIVVTTLENYFMPLIRYAIGDYGIRSGSTACPCGRTLPLLDKVLGRSINMFRQAGNRIISPWEIVVRLKYLPGLSQFQIIQKSLSRFVFRVRLAFPLTDENRSAVSAIFTDILGDQTEIDFEQVDEIPRAASGKFMTAVSEVSM